MGYGWMKKQNAGCGILFSLKGASRFNMCHNMDEDSMLSDISQIKKTNTM